jgi:His-Xaa-Ser system protein HxsD
MSSRKESVITQHGEGYLVNLDKSFFSKRAVLSAAYKFTGRNIIEIFPLEEGAVGILFKPKNGNFLEDVEKDAVLFLNEVLDQQVRVNLEQDFGHVREIIVEHAFSPVKKK